MEKITSLDKFLKEEKDGAVLAIHELLVIAAKQHATKEESE